MYNNFYKNKYPTTKVNHNFYENNTKVSNMRKSKIFIKSRFSRNRQWCRPIVFWSLWLNILFLGFSTAIFYGFKFNVSLIPNLWILFGLFIIMPVFISKLK